VPHPDLVGGLHFGDNRTVSAAVLVSRVPDPMPDAVVAGSRWPARLVRNGSVNARSPKLDELINLFNNQPLLFIFVASRKQKKKNNKLVGCQTA
jgi:hypothetical protein